MHPIKEILASSENLILTCGHWTEIFSVTLKNDRTV